ncbi:hypothetical protein [Kitasatospora sp. NPDC004531]
MNGAAAINGDEQPTGRPDAWRYRFDEGTDPAGRVPVHAVRGNWPPGPDAAYRPHPRHRRPLADPHPADAPPPGLPPLGAGRRPAGRALLAWLEDTRGPRLCRVAGASGSGRTHLLTWLAAACPPDHPRPGRRVHALLDVEGLTVRSATARLADLLGLTAGHPADLLEALQDGAPRTVVVTDLDRAGGPGLPGTPERVAAELLAPLLSIPWLLLVVEAADGPAADLLTAAAPSGAVLDLDQPQWTDPAQYGAWCGRLTGHPFDPAATHPSPGLAQLAARTPGAVLDPARTPAERAAALADTWWAALPDAERGALTALSTADGPVSTELWATLPGAGGEATVKSAADLLPPPPMADRWRLRPDEVAARIAADRPPVDHGSMMWEVAGGIPVRADGGPDLAASDPERLALLLRHACAADPASPLLGELDLLLHAEPATVTAAFQRAEDAGAPAGPLAEAWRLAAPDRAALARPADRAAVLHAWLTGRDATAAAHCAALAETAGARWKAVWNRPGVGPCMVALGVGPRTGSLLLFDGAALHLADPATGEPTGAATPLTCRHPRALTATPFGGALLLDASGALCSLAVDGAVGAPPGTLETLGPCTAVAGHHDALVLGHPDGLTSHSTLSTGRTHRPGTPLHDGPVTALGVTDADGGTLVVSGGEDGRVWTWMPGRPPLPAPVDQRPHPVTATALGATPGGLLLAAAWSDGLLRLRRWGERHRGADIRLGSPVRSLAVTPDGLVLAALPEAVLALALVG